MRLNEIRELTLVRLRLFAREPEAVFWSIIFPIILSVVLGFAFSKSEVEASKVLVLEGPGSEAIVERLKSDDKLEVKTSNDPVAARKALRKAAVDVVVEMAEPTNLRVDPQRPEGELARLRVESGLRPESEAQTRTQSEAEEGFRYIDFLFPGLIGMNIMGTGIWAIGFAIVDMRRKKLLKRLLVTPMTRSSFLFSFMSSRILFLALELAILLPFGMLVLGVPFAGSILAFATTIFIGTLSFASIGLLVCARPQTLEGASGLMNVIMMPMWLGSGVFFSYERFPEFLHPVLSRLPLSALNDAIRGVMLDGRGLTEVLPECLVLGIWAVFSFSISLRIFRWQ